MRTFTPRAAIPRPSSLRCRALAIERDRDFIRRGRDLEALHACRVEMVLGGRDVAERHRLEVWNLVLGEQYDQRGEAEGQRTNRSAERCRRGAQRRLDEHLDT